MIFNIESNDDALWDSLKHQNMEGQNNENNNDDQVPRHY